MTSRTSKELAGLAMQMTALAADMRSTCAGVATKAATPAGKILQAYRHGERKPVEGPLTYVEALAMVNLNERMLTALKDLVDVPGTRALQARALAHYNAVTLIAEIEVGQ